MLRLSKKSPFAVAALLLVMANPVVADSSRSNTEQRPTASHAAQRQLQPGRFTHHRGRSFDMRRSQFRDQPYMRRETKTRARSSK